MKPSKVFVAGTFDNFHVGHQYLLYQAGQKGSDLVVVVARDRTVCSRKGYQPQNNERQRLARVKAEGVKHAIIRLGREDGNFLQTLEEENPDILLLGYDQKIDEGLFKKHFPELVIQRAVPYFPEYFKSSFF